MKFTDKMPGNFVLLWLTVITGWSISLVTCRANGAPKSTCVTMTPGHYEESKSINRYVVSLVNDVRTYTPGVTVEGKGGITPGVLHPLPRKKYARPIHKIELSRFCE